MARSEKPELTVVSGKGQVVIPQTIRKKLGLEPKTKLLVYDCEDAIILKKLEVPDIAKELEAMYKRIDKRIAKYGELTNEEINEIIHEHRRKKRASV
ncbi:MAG TPA: AbrB/MazE/SpoVT family DNA-binding domain-containing protein [Candidatus Bathyarchaeia archaeon]|nr:AbrB/MazE/SpoVT family DNA-binding domain-containing protein [Candidatus Bathyarchaeia archaeon]